MRWDAEAKAVVVAPAALFKEQPAFLFEGYEAGFDGAIAANGSTLLHGLVARGAVAIVVGYGQQIDGEQFGFVGEFFFEQAVGDGESFLADSHIQFMSTLAAFISFSELSVS